MGDQKVRVSSKKSEDTSISCLPEDEKKKIVRIVNELVASKQKVITLNSQVNELESRLADESSKLSWLEKELSQKNQEIEDYRENIKALTYSLTASTARSVSGNPCEKCKIYETQIISLKSSISFMESDIQRHSDLITTQQKTIQNYDMKLSSQLKEKEDIIQSLNDRLSVYQKENEILNQTNQQQNNSVSYKEKYDILVLEYEQYKIKYQEMEQRVQRIQHQLQEYTNNNNDNNQHHHFCSIESYNTLKQQNNELLLEKTKLIHQIEELKHQNQQLHITLSTYEVNKKNMISYNKEKEEKDKHTVISTMPSLSLYKQDLYDNINTDDNRYKDRIISKNDSINQKNYNKDNHIVPAIIPIQDNDNNIDVNEEEDDDDDDDDILFLNHTYSKDISSFPFQLSKISTNATTTTTATTDTTAKNNNSYNHHNDNMKSMDCDGDQDIEDRNKNRNRNRNRYNDGNSNVSNDNNNNNNMSHLPNNTHIRLPTKFKHPKQSRGQHSQPSLSTSHISSHPLNMKETVVDDRNTITTTEVSTMMDKIQSYTPFSTTHSSTSSPLSPSRLRSMSPSRSSSPSTKSPIRRQFMSFSSSSSSSLFNPKQLDNHSATTASSAINDNDTNTNIRDDINNVIHVYDNNSKNFHYDRYMTNDFKRQLYPNQSKSTLHNKENLHVHVHSRNNSSSSSSSSGGGEVKKPMIPTKNSNNRSNREINKGTKFIDSTVFTNKVYDSQLNVSLVHDNTSLSLRNSMEIQLGFHGEYDNSLFDILEAIDDP